MKKIVVKKSKIHGTGLFLEEDVSRRDFISYIRGHLSTLKKQKIHTPEAALMYPNWIGVSMSYWIDPAMPFRYLNHSCDPSCGVKGKRRLYALRDLKAGDEITVDYSTIEANPHWQIKCSCGSKKCRGIVRALKYLPLSNFKKYYPFFPTAFRKFYIRYKHLSIKGNPWIKKIKVFS
ncbi:MAG: SET domain-containing protein-lysine N-methyltransferase [Patescibacteria group bacterium]